MGLDLMIEKYAGSVSTVSIGATKKEGGTRSKIIQVGGQTALPFLFKEGLLKNKPVVAFEILDIPPTDWPAELTNVYGDVLDDSIRWAKKCVKEYKADLLCVKLQGASPDFGNKDAVTEAKFISRLLQEVDVPLIICGCADDAKDNLVMPAVAEASRGERCLIGSALQDNYKTLAAAVVADGHNIIAESPIDINIAKQLNILISDVGLDLNRIVINPTIGALGYGLEYAYSIMERARSAALAGDKTLASPFICFVAQETWRTKESKEESSPETAITWEIITAIALLQSGADILVMRHPKAIEEVRKYIDELYA